MRAIIDLSFFGGGSSSTTTAKTHGDKSAYLNNMDNAVYQFFQPITEKYGGITMSDIGQDEDGKPTVKSSSTGSTGSTVKTSDDGTVSTGKGTTSSTDNSSSGTTTTWLTDPNNVMGQGFAQADNIYTQGLQNESDLLNSSNSILNKQTSITDEAAEAARKSQQQAAADMTRASGYLDDYDTLYDQFKANNYGQEYADQAEAYNNAMAEYLAEHAGDSAKYADQLEDLTNNSNTNQALKNYMSGVYDSINSNLNTKASNALAGAAARGIINSSTSNKAISDLEKNAQNTAAEQYATGFSNLANNYNSLINAANNNLSTTTSAYGTASDAARSLYDSYNSNMQGNLSNLLSASNQAATNAKLGTETANNTVSNLMSVASGYGDAYKNNLSGIEANQNAASSAYTTALAPIMSAYQYWRDLNTDYTNEETEDTIVSSGGK